MRLEATKGKKRLQQNGRRALLPDGRGRTKEKGLDIGARGSDKARGCISLEAPVPAQFSSSPLSRSLLISAAKVISSKLLAFQEELSKKSYEHIQISPSTEKTVRERKREKEKDRKRKTTRKRERN